MPITSRPDRAVRHEQPDVGADALLLVGGALRGEVDRPAAVGIDEHGGEALREQRLPVLQLFGREAAAGVRVDVDEARRDVAIGGVDHGLRRGVAAATPSRAMRSPRDADVGAIPGIAGAVEDAPVADQDVELLRRLRGRDGHDGAEDVPASAQERAQCAQSTADSWPQAVLPELERQNVADVFAAKPCARTARGRGRW